MNVIKPVIPRQIATIIESLRQSGWTAEESLNSAFYNGEDDAERTLFHYFRHNRATFAAAVINGYDVERTAEERIQAMFDEAVRHEEVAPRLSTETWAWWEARRMTIIDTLDALGVKIPEVNA